MIIPIDQVTNDTLTEIITAFILREGTDYGEVDVPLAEKIAQVKHQLDNGSAVLVYSELHETVDIVPADKIQFIE